MSLFIDKDIDNINIRIPQGAEFRENFEYLNYENNPIDFTNLEAKCIFRSKADKNSPVIFEVNSTTSSGGVIFLKDNGIIEIVIRPFITETLSKKVMFYDVMLFDPNNISKVTRAFQGMAILDSQVTTI